MMELETFIFILICISSQHATTEKQYIYVQEEISWSEAHKFCEQNDSVMSALNNRDITSIKTCNQSSEELWTSSFVYATPYLSIMGCFRNTTSLNFSKLIRPSILDCQDLCSTSSAFAIMDTKCACLDDIYSLVETGDANLCNITCEGTFFCGGKDTVNVYSVVEEKFFNRRQHQTNPDFTSCMSYQCVNNDYLYKDVDCSSEEVTEAACSTFFSCTFELGDPCFLSQVKNDSFDWTITSGNTTIGPQKAHQGSNFAFVNDSSGDYQQGSRASLRSNIEFPDFRDSDWCLRFWVYLSNTSVGGNLQVYTKNSVGESSNNKTFSTGQYTEWKYSENDIQVQKNDIIFFELIRGSTGSNFALDDVTLTKGKCGNTYSKVLYMSGEVKCDFEGNEDICFDQEKGDNFDWMITRNGQTTKDRDTGPRNNIEGNYFSYIDTSEREKQDNLKGVLVSKFNLTDVNITFSMQYNMYGKDINKLKVYLKNESDEIEIFNKTGDQGMDWKLFKCSIKIEGKWKLHISANRKKKTLGDIAIDDIRIKINQPDVKSNWMNQNKRCKDNLGGYAINHQQLPYLPCLSFGPDRWTGIIRPSTRGTATNVLEKHPTKVKIYRNLSASYKYVWESFNVALTRPFVCEKNLSTSKELCVVLIEKESVFTPNSVNTTSSSDTVVGILVACVLIVFVGIIVLLIYYKRKKGSKNKGQRDIPLITKEKANYLNDSKKINIQSKYPNEKNMIEEEENKQKTHEGKEKTSLYQYQKKSYTDKGAYDLPTETIELGKEPEEDYDHLHHANNSMTSKSDDLYSHVIEDQYESRKMLTDDTYAHTADMENEYGVPQVTHHADEVTYDHAHAQNIDPDEE